MGLALDAGGARRWRPVTCRSARSWWTPTVAVLGTGVNRREADGDPTAHAEVLALRSAAAALGEWRLAGCTLVVTLEPCTMCAGALVLARVSRLVFGAWDPKAGAAGSVWDVVRDRRVNHRVEVVAGVRADGVLAAAARLSSPATAARVVFSAVACPSGLRSTPRKRVRGQLLRGFKSHRHRHRMSQDIGSSRTHDDCGFGSSSFAGWVRGADGPLVVG